MNFEETLQMKDVMSGGSKGLPDILLPEMNWSHDVQLELGRLPIVHTHIPCMNKVDGCQIQEMLHFRKNMDTDKTKPLISPVQTKEVV
jgi:hypothetical protein